MKFCAMSRPAFFWVAIVVSPLTMAQSFGVVTVGRAGQENCTTDSLEQALKEAAKSTYDDVIWISKDVGPNFFPDGTIEIKDQNVEIIGGFEDCNGFAGPSGYQLLTGAGGQSESVIRIRGESNVRLSHLEISGGDEDDPSDEGGGIDFKGKGSLTLSHVRLNNNKAGYGGGLFVSGGTDADPLEVTLDGDVAITDNVAARNGGGIYVSGSVDLTMSGFEVGLHRNVARGVRVNNAIVDGYGGGLYMKRPARAAVSAVGYRRPSEPSPYPIFWMNTARYGGGVAAVGVLDNNIRTSHLVMSGSVLEWNRALVEGGGIYFGTYVGYVGTYWFCGNSVEFNGNAAPRGAAVFASADGNQAGFQMRNVCGANPAFVCQPGATCGRFVGNRTESEDGEPTEGAVIEFPGQNGNLALDKVMFSENQAGTAIFMGDNGDSDLLLTNCLIADNVLSRYAIDTDASNSLISQCTIAGNTLGGTHALRVVESDAQDGNVMIKKSIIYQPGVSVLDYTGPLSQSEVRYLMVNSSLGLPANSNVLVGDPQFNHARFPYGLSVGSKAVDYAPNDDSLERDRAGYARTVDQPLDHNEFGPRDLGAYELEIYGERIFFDGFGR